MFAQSFLQKDSEWWKEDGEYDAYNVHSKCGCIVVFERALHSAGICIPFRRVVVLTSPLCLGTRGIL